MSFGFTATITRDDVVRDKVVAAYDGPNGAGGSPRQHQEENGTAGEAADLVKAASAAAEMIAIDLGEKWLTANVNVSGHANPGHAARPGWANDFVAVTVTVASYAPAEDPALT